MAKIQITDLNPSDFGFMEELTDEELLAINGGRWALYLSITGLVLALVGLLLNE